MTYKTTRQGDLSMRIRRPEGWKASDKRPAIVFYFCGGWTNGSTKQSASTRRCRRPSSFYGTDDRLAEPTEPFMARAKAKGARVELFMTKGVGHGFFNRSPWTERP